MKVSRSFKWLLAILVLGTGLRLAWVYYVNTQPISDFKHYHDLALSLLQRGSYTMPEGLDYIKDNTPYIQQGVHYPSAFRPPGYPIFLAFLYFFYPSILTAKLANVALGIVWMVCMYLLGRKYLNEQMALWAAFLTAIFPPAISYTSVISTEILSVALLLVILCLFAYRVGGRWNPLWIGAFMGFLSLVKPYFFVFPVLYGILLWWQSGKGKKMKGFSLREIGVKIFGMIRPAMWAGVVMALVISPWTLRNYLVFHHFVPISTNGDFVLYINNNDLNKGMYMNAMDVPHSIFKTNRILNAKGEYNEVEAMKLARQEALKWIREHPRSFLFLGLDRLSVSFFNVGREIEEWSLSPGEIRFDPVWVTPLLQGGRAATFIVTGSGFFYMLLILYQYIRRRLAHNLHKINLLFLLFFTAVIFASEGQPRYVFIMYPFFILGVSWMIDSLNPVLRGTADGSSLEK